MNRIVAGLFLAVCFGTPSFAGISSIVRDPGGSNTNVQYNDNGTFGGKSNFTYNGTTVTAPAVSVTTGVFSGPLTAATINTGLGAFELYDISPTATPTFSSMTLTNGVHAATATIDGAASAATLNTGQGANELYPMDQAVLTTSSPTFAQVTATFIGNGAGLTGLPASGDTVYPATATASFPFGFSASTAAFSVGVDIPNSGTSTTTFKGLTRNAEPLIHNHTIATTSGENLFVGINSGNILNSAAAGAPGNYSYNLGLGDNTFAPLTTGAQNTGIGHSAGLSLETGVANTSVGYFSLVTAVSGSSNTALGMSALQSTTGNGNIGLGAYAGAYETGSNAFYVNDRDRTDTATEKAQSLLYGVMADDPANQSLTVNGALTALTLNTGNGAFELYGMNQGVRTTDTPTFSSATLTGGLNVSSGPVLVPQLSTTTISVSTPVAAGQLIQSNSTGLYNLYVGTATNDAGDFKRLTDRGRQLTIVLDGGGSEITDGAKKIYLRVPYDMTLTGWDIVGDVSGAIVVDLWKDTYANFPPTDVDSFTGTELPTITASGVKGQDLSLTSMTTSLSAGDYIEANVDSCTDITKAVINLYGVLR